MQLKSLNNISPSFREDNEIVFIDENNNNFSWGELWRGVAFFQNQYLLGDESDQYVLFSQNRIKFLVAFLALLKEGKDIILSGALPAETRKKFFEKGIPVFDEANIQFEKNDKKLTPLEKEAISTIYLYTSGSSGEAQLIEKKLPQLDAEVNNLLALWGGEFSGKKLCSSVSHQHIYGFLFVILIPLFSGTPVFSFFVEYPELLSGLSSKELIFISTPAFLKRLNATSVVEGRGRLKTIFSSGGALPDEVGAALRSNYNIPVIEVYGSTETGGVAWRDCAISKEWTPFSGVETGLSAEGTLKIRSPYLSDKDFFTTSDLVEFEEGGSFKLIGRRDSIVKMEEKRISLKEISLILESHLFIEEAHAVLLDGGTRQAIGVVAVCSSEGDFVLKEEGRKAFVRKLRNFFAESFDRIFIPRKWRFVDKIPEDKQGKVARVNLLALFSPKHSRWTYEISEIDLKEKKMIVSTEFSPGLAYFKGHFDGNPVLPGLAQTDFALSMAERHLGFPSGVREIPQLKFLKPILPGEKVLCELKIKVSPESVVFRFFSPQDGETFSRGKLKRVIRTDKELG